jgi:ribosomal protein S30
MLKAYESLFGLYGAQKPSTIFAHFYPMRKDPNDPKDYDEPFKEIARKSMDGYDSWIFQQPKFRAKHAYSAVPKLKNYLNYTFVRLVTLEQENAGEYFFTNADQSWICFNTGLQNSYGADLLAMFQRYKPKPESQAPAASRPDWVYKGCHPSNDAHYRGTFGNRTPKIAWYSRDSKDYVFDTSYGLDKDAFDHLFERAKERAGLPNQSDEVTRNYLRGAIENLVPKILRNYKWAIPVYYVEEKRMQLLLPFYSANPGDISAFLVERDDANRSYRIKTIFDLDQAYFSARLITRPDKDWLNP